jgi:hypothetical protein
MTAFDKHQVSRFRFVRCEFAAETGVAKLVYAFDDGPEMVETITVPGARSCWTRRVPPPCSVRCSCCT